jgi:hypothetical protein
LSASNNTITKKGKPGKTTAFFICVLLASFLWLVKALNTSYTRTVRVPVEFRNIPQNTKPLNGIPEYLNVDIKASGLKLFFILMNQPFKKLEIDFNDLKPSRRNYVISSTNIQFKKSLKFETVVKQISPDTLYFVEKNGYQKTVPVKITGSVKCARGYGFATPVISPPFLTIVGDSAALRNVDTIYTQNIILENLKESVEKNLSVLKPADDVYLNDNKVRISIKVEKLMEHSLYLPLVVLNPPRDAKSVHVFPSGVRLKFTTLQNDFNVADSIHFRAAVNVAQSRGKKSPVFLSTQPGNVNILSIEPAEAEILIIRK